MDDGWLLIDVQSRSSNRGAEGQFAVNLGVYNSTIARLAEQQALPKRPDSSYAVVRKRLGVEGGKYDHWREVGEGADLQTVADDVVEKMTTPGLPWLQEFNDLQRISDFLRDSPSVTSFSAALALGDEQEVVRRVKAAVELVPSFTNNATAWAERAELCI